MPETQISNISEESYPSQTVQPGFLKRILWVITSPGRLMECLAEKPRVIFGIILSALAYEVLCIVRLPLYKDMLRASSIASMDYMESLTGQQISAEMIEASLPAAVVQGLIVTPVSTVIGLLLSTLIFFGIFKIIGGQGKFKAYLSVSSYSYVISALYFLIIIPVSFITESLHLDVSLTSLAALAPDDMSGTFLFGVLKGIDVFSIWKYAVMGIGFAAVSKLKKKYVYATMAAIFVIRLLIGAAGEAALGAIF